MSRERQFNQRLSEEAHRLIDVLQKFYGLKSKADLLEMVMREHARSKGIPVEDDEILEGYLHL